MNKKNKLLQWLLFVAVFLNVGALHVTADNEMAVSVNAILPENQHNKQVTYYDLRMKPNQTQELALELNNPSDKDEKIKVEINNGTTNDGGTIDYSNRSEELERDNTLKIALTDVATTPTEVLVKANSVKTIKVKLVMPKEVFDGEIIGAIRISKVENPKKEKKTSANGMQINNKVAYTVGVSLTETDNEVAAELGLIKAFASQTNGRNVVKATIQNSQARLLEELAYSGYVTAKGKESVMHMSSTTDYRFAPNSSFNFDISWENKPFKAGDYTLHLKANSKDTGQKWEWTEDFKISALEAKRLNKTAIGLEKETSPFIMIIISTIGMLVVVIILIIICQKWRKTRDR